MALPPHAGELGTELLPTVTSLGGPGHTQAAWPWGQRAETRGVLRPSQTGVSRPAPATPFWGRKGGGRGLAAIPTSSSPGQGHRNAAGHKQLSSFMPVSLSAPSGLFSMGIFQMKSHCETFLGHTPTCAPRPASSRGEGRDREMEMCMGKEKEREGNSCGNRERVGKCLGKCSGR